MTTRKFHLHNTLRSLAVRMTSAIMLPTLSVAAISVTTLTWTGCTGVRSRILPSSFDPNALGNSEGVSYFLPTNSVRVVFTNETIASEINKAKSALEEAKAAKAEHDAEIVKLEGAKKNAAGKPDELKEIDKKLETEKSKLKSLTETLNKATAAVTTAETRAPQILVEELPPVPDTSKAYAATLTRNGFTDDTVTIHTTADGLLTSVDYRSDDQTGTVVQNLVKTAIETGKLYARIQGPIGGTAEGVAAAAAEAGKHCPDLSRFDPNSPTDAVSKPVKPYYYENTFDPSDRKSVASVNLSLLMASIPYLIDIRPATAGQTGTPTKAPDLSGKSAHGLLYRRSVPYDVVIYEDRLEKDKLCKTIYAKDVNKKELIDDATKIERVLDFLNENQHYMPTVRSAQMTMPAGGAVAWLDLTARPFVETHITASFAAGQLTSVTTDRPSELVGFTEIPLNAVTAVGNAAGEVIDNILPLQLKYTNDEAALIEARTELLKEQQAYEELLEAIREGTYVPDDGSEGAQPDSGPGATSGSDNAN